MEEKEFKDWLEERRRSINLHLDAEGHWWHDDQPFIHAGLVAAFNRGIERHQDTNEPIIRIGSTWCYFHSVGSPFIVRRVLSTQQVITGFRLNTQAEVHVHTLEFKTTGSQIIMTHETYADIKFDRASQAALGPFLSESESGVYLNTSVGRVAVQS